LTHVGALVNSARSHQTALHMAAMKQNDAVARLLVDFGADVYAENKSGLQPSGLVPAHQPLYHFLCHCESTDLFYLLHKSEILCLFLCVFLKLLDSELLPNLE